MANPTQTGDRRRVTFFSRSVPSFVVFWLSAWVLAASAVAVLVSVPAFRAPWSAARTLEWIDGDLLVSEPLTNFGTPYVSFARVRFSTGATGTGASGTQLTIVGGGAPVRSHADLDARSLTSLPLHAQGDFEYAWSAPPRQLDPSETVRLVFSGVEHRRHPPGVRVSATLGYDGKAPAVRAVRY